MIQTVQIYLQKLKDFSVYIHKLAKYRNSKKCLKGKKRKIKGITQIKTEVSLLFCLGISQAPFLLTKHSLVTDCYSE